MSKTPKPVCSPTMEVVMLKPCPFCGSSNVMIYGVTHNGDRRMKHMGKCFDCGATGREHNNPALAVESWNTRAE